MDTPESPTQSPQSPEEDERGLSDNELLDSPDEEEDRVISDSEIVHEEDEEEMESRVRGSELEGEREEGDEVVPDFVSDPEDEEPVGEMEGMGQEDEAMLLMEVDDDHPKGDQLDGEREEQEDRVIDTPQSPDSEPEQGKSFIAEEDGDDREEVYSDYRKKAPAEPQTVKVDEEEEEHKSKAEEEDEMMRAEQRRRAVAVRDDSVSVSRELDEHELDYDEEVPEEPSIPIHEEEEDDEDTKAEGEVEESKEKSSKKEKKTILPPSPTDSDIKRTDDSKGPERMHRDSFRDKKKDEDDGEIDEGEIDVSDPSFTSSCLLISVW